MGDDRWATVTHTGEDQLWLWPHTHRIVVEAANWLRRELGEGVSVRFQGTARVIRAEIISGGQALITVRNDSEDGEIMTAGDSRDPSFSHAFRYPGELIDIISIRMRPMVPRPSEPNAGSS